VERLTEEIKFIESFGKLELKEGDIIVLKTDRKLSSNEFENVGRSMDMIIKRWGFENVNCLILDEGMDIGVISKK
jgi:hypothetical protein